MATPTDQSRATFAFIAPLVAFLLISSLEPRFSEDSRFSRTESDATASRTTQNAHQPVEPLSESARAKVNWYLLTTCVKLAVVGGLLAYYFPLYLRLLPIKLNWMAVAVGIIGFVLWVGICAAALEQKSLVAIGFSSHSLATRSEFNPFVAIQSAGLRTLFLIARLVILGIAVPIAEELFLRGFLMRYFQDPDWLKPQFNQLGAWPLAVGTLYGIATHPSEALAAAVWFSLVSWLMVRTNSFWNCVLAHALTNGLFGAYVLLYSQWQLW